MRNGACYARPTSAPPTAAPECSSLLPTPTAANPNDGEDPARWLERKAHHAEKPEGATRAGMPLAIAARLLLTPRASDAKGWSAPSRDRPQGPGGLEEQLRGTVLLPTPTATDAKSSANMTRGTVDSTTESSHLGMTLLDAGRIITDPTTQRRSLLPTPTARDANGATDAANRAGGASLGQTAQQHGATTGPPSSDGNTSSAAQLPLF